MIQQLKEHFQVQVQLAIVSVSLSTIRISENWSCCVALFCQEVTDLDLNHISFDLSNVKVYHEQTCSWTPMNAIPK